MATSNSCVCGGGWICSWIISIYSVGHFIFTRPLPRKWNVLAVLWQDPCVYVEDTSHILSDWYSVHSTRASLHPVQVIYVYFILQMEEKLVCQVVNILVTLAPLFKHESIDLFSYWWQIIHWFTNLIGSPSFTVSYPASWQIQKCP